MLSPATAAALQQAGLPWAPARLDFFIIPNSNLDGQVFVLTEMPANLALLQGRPVLTFDGAAEWALDYVAATEVVWLPTEAQLREQLASRLAAGGPASVLLSTTPEGWRCEIDLDGQVLAFAASDASEAYAAALLRVLRRAAL
jgi:hypothetical protein